MLLNEYLEKNWTGNKSAFGRHIGKHRQRVEYMCDKCYEVIDGRIMREVLTLPERKDEDKD